MNRSSDISAYIFQQPSFLRPFLLISSSESTRRLVPRLVPSTSCNAPQSIINRGIQSKKRHRACSPPTYHCTHPYTLLSRVACIFGIRLRSGCAHNGNIQRPIVSLIGLPSPYSHALPSVPPFFLPAPSDIPHRVLPQHQLTHTENALKGLTLLTCMCQNGAVACSSASLSTIQVWSVTYQVVVYMDVRSGRLVETSIMIICSLSNSTVPLTRYIGNCRYTCFSNSIVFVL